MDNRDDSWHLSKSVPISFILAILMQTIALVWYVSSLDSNVEANTREIARHELRLMELEKLTQSQAVMLGRIDENINSIRKSVEAMMRSRAN
jgi:CII-binding regulator of phage lambda lysogenization HflD